MSRDTQLPKIRSLVGLLSDIGICRIHDKAKQSPSLSGNALGKLYEADRLTLVDRNGSAPLANDRTVVEHSDRLAHFESLIIVENRAVCELVTKSTPNVGSISLNL